MNENQDSFFRDKLYDLESPLNERLTFEEVMERRKKKRRFIFWWNPKVYVIAGLFVVGGVGLYLANPFDKHQNPISTKNLTNKVVFADKSSQSLGVKDSKKEKTLTVEPKDSKLKSEDFSVESNKLKVINTDAQLLESQLNVDNQLRQSVNLNQSKNRWRNSHGRRGFAIESDNQIQILDEQIFESSKEYLKSGRNGAKHLESFLSVGSTNIGQKNYLWNNSNEIIRSLALTTSRISFPEFDFSTLDIELDLPERPVLPKLPSSKWYAELSVITGSNNTINFEENVPLSILGTQYMAQYQFLLLKDLENGSMLGGGVQYSEWVGNGQWQQNENKMVQKIDTSIVLISMPWQPKKYATIIDTSFVPANIVKTGNIEYRIDKISFPLAYRFYTQIAKTPIRLGIHLAPGYTTVNKGTYFTNTDFQAIESGRHATIDGKLSIGPMISISKKWTLVMEPSIIYQSFLTNNHATVNGKFFTGLGVAILRKL